TAGTGVEFGDAADLSPSIVIPIANVTNLTTELAGKLTATTTSPVTGQVIWYNGTTFVNGPRVTTSTTEPTTPAGGDIFFDQGNKAVKIYDNGTSAWDTVADVGGGGGG